MRSSPARQTRLLLAALILAGCVGERGEATPDKPTPAAAPAPAPATPAPVAGPGTCEATSDKLVELSTRQAASTGKPWTVEKQDQKRRHFLENCRKELPVGKVTRETLLCVESAKQLSEAQGCLLAATR